MARKNWSDEEKNEALRLLADPSATFYEVRDATGVPVGTLHRWATEAGLERSQDVTKEATQARVARTHSRRTILQELLLDAAIDHTERALAEDKAQSAQAFQTAAAIAHDKFRLEMGEATSRTETRSTDAAQQAKAKVDELAARRAKKTA